MNKKRMSIFMFVFTMSIMYVGGETNSAGVVPAGLPPLFENSTGYPPETSVPAPAGQERSASVPVPSVPAPAAPVPPAPLSPAPPAPPSVQMPGPASPGVPPASGMNMSGSTYTINVSPDRVQKVLTTAHRIENYLEPGKIWIVKDPEGILEIKGGITYRGVVVAVVSFSPVDGSALPADFRLPVYEETVSLQTVKNVFSRIIGSMKMLDGAWLREPERSWIVPLSYKGMVIASVRIYYDGIHVLPDYEAGRNMAYYGQ